MKYQMPRACPRFTDGMTLIELITLAVPSYHSYTMRVHRTEAIRMLLQASICQERVRARHGNYDTGRCQIASGQQRYRLSYKQSGAVGQTYKIVAAPQGAQRSDPCGALWLDQNGTRGISADNISVMKCWNGR